MKTTLASRLVSAHLSLHCALLSAVIGTSFLATASAIGGDFTPGSGSPIPVIPPLVEEPGIIGGLNAVCNQRQNYHYIGGTYANVDFRFPAPMQYGATGYRLQRSSDGMVWEDFLYNGAMVETQSDSQDNFSIIHELPYA